MKSFVILIITAVTILTNCKKHKQEPSSEDYLLTRSLLFYLKDSLNGNNLIGRNGERYDADSIRVTAGSEKGRTILDSSGQYCSGIMYLFATATKEEDINNMHIDLPLFVYLNQHDTDTIIIKKEFNQQIKFYYNNVLVDSTPALNKNIPVLTIKK